MTILNQKLKAAAIIILIAVVIVGVTYAISSQISNTGHVNAPANLELSVTSFNWGPLNVGDAPTKSVNIKNIGEQTTTALSFTDDAPTGLDVTWNVAAGTTLAPQETVTATFTLTVTSSASPGDFSFLITIAA